MNTPSTFLLLGAAALCACAQPYPAPVDETRVDALLAQLTLEEKVELLSGDESDFNAQGVARVGIPSLRMADGPVGVRLGSSTAFPVSINLAATWDPALAERFGSALADETLAKGRTCILGPCVGIHRFPLNGRNFESYGEDPWLSSRIAVGTIRGIQSRGVVATVKHFAVNDQEWERREIDVLVDERTLREIHLPAFEAAVREAGVLAVMASYNRINGPHASQCAPLLHGILKREWGFPGIVMSDWDSVYTAAGAANAGLDLEMPSALWFGAPLLDAVRDGRVAVATLDDKVRRHLRVRLAAGIFDHPAPPENESLVSNDIHRRLAREIAHESIVLLKNDENLLPLAPEKLRRVALIGPAMSRARTGGGGSSLVLPRHPTTPLEGIAASLAPSVEYSFEEGVVIDPYRPAAVPAECFTLPDRSGPGVRAEYFPNADCDGEPTLVRTEPSIDFALLGGSPAPDLDKDHFSARWTGWFTPPVTHDYQLALASDDGSRLWLDGELVIDHWGAHSMDTKVATIRLEGGRAYRLRAEFCELGGDATMRFGWRAPDDHTPPPSIEAAVAAARTADVAIVAVGLASFLEGEGHDVADFQLPGEQDALVRAVAAANPRTVVVVYGGVPQRLEHWICRVPAVLAAFYPGQEGGAALADLLLGREAPSGRLPFSYIQCREQSPAFAGYRTPDLKSRYTEGVFVGYRWLDAHGIAPLFPFGHGLTYTTFAYANLRATRAGDGTTRVSVDITNTGDREGAEVVQLYVAPPADTPVPRPPQELKAFAKVRLAPGETRTVELPLGPRAFQFWSPDTQGWTTAPGAHELRVGASSRDIRARTALEMK